MTNLELLAMSYYSSDFDLSMARTEQNTLFSLIPDIKVSIIEDAEEMDKEAV